VGMSHQKRTEGRTSFMETLTEDNIFVFQHRGDASAPAHGSRALSLSKSCVRAQYAKSEAQAPSAVGTTCWLAISLCVPTPHFRSSSFKASPTAEGSASGLTTQSRFIAVATAPVTRENVIQEVRDSTKLHLVCASAPVHREARSVPNAWLITSATSPETKGRTCWTKSPICRNPTKNQER
jgi:hypothetical protein